jgi:hypothetical protein
MPTTRGAAGTISAVARKKRRVYRMPIIYRIKADAKLIITAHVGTVPDDEFLEAYRQLFADPMFSETFNLLVDLRRTTSAERSTTALRDLSIEVDHRYRDSSVAPKTAVIAPSDLSFGLGRMYQSFVAMVPGDVVIFRAVDTALAWLGAPPDVLDDTEDTIADDSRKESK